MKNMNTEIKVDVSRLNCPVRTLFARQYAVYRVRIVDVPGDFLGVFLRLVSNDGASYRDFAAVATPDSGCWKCTVPAFALSEAGNFTYEIHAELDGEKAALGRGMVCVMPFTCGGGAPAVDKPVTVAQMPTRDGGWVNCVAVMDETGEYTYSFERIEEDA